jgi:hypothetical protein
MRHNSNGWFLIGCTISSLIFLVTSSNSFCSPLWKVAIFSRSIYGCSSCFGLLACPISTFSCKTCSFFSLWYSFLSTLLAYCKWLQKVVIYGLFWLFHFYFSNNNNNKSVVCFGKSQIVLTNIVQIGVIMNHKFWIQYPWYSCQMLRPLSELPAFGRNKIKE